MQKTFFISGAILGGLAVAIGAYGAHGGENLWMQNLQLLLEKPFVIRCITL